MANIDRVDPTVAKLLQQILADSDESAAHKLTWHDADRSIGTPSSVFFVSTLPKDHPLYTRNHGWEIIDESTEDLAYTQTKAKPAMRRQAV